MRPKYILLTDQVALRKDRGLLARLKSEETQALQGSLWQLFNEETQGEKRASKLTLTSLEYEGVVLSCSSKEVERITEPAYELLIAMNTCAERYKVFKDRDWLREGLEMTKGAIVLVSKVSDLPERVPGQVKYKGPLPSQMGIWFGVELSAEYHGKGTSDGTFRHNQYFRSPPDSAVFVPLHKVRRCQKPSLFRDWTLNLPSDSSKYDEERPPLLISDRVVWMSDNGPEAGTVKWIGYLHDTRDKEWTVGVEFDNPVGTGTGKYKDRQLFRARHGHASLVPILGLMKESEFYGNDSGPAMMPQAPSRTPPKDLRVSAQRDKNHQHPTSTVTNITKQRTLERSPSGTTNSTPSPKMTRSSTGDSGKELDNQATLPLDVKLPKQESLEKHKSPGGTSEKKYRTHRHTLSDSTPRAPPPEVPARKCRQSANSVAAQQLDATSIYDNVMPSISDMSATSSMISEYNYMTVDATQLPEYANIKECRKAAQAVAQNVESLAVENDLYMCTNDLVDGIMPPPPPPPPDSVVEIVEDVEMTDSMLPPPPPPTQEPEVIGIDKLYGSDPNIALHRRSPSNSSHGSHGSTASSRHSNEVLREINLNTNHVLMTTHSPMEHAHSAGGMGENEHIPTPVSASQINCDVDIGSMVEVIGNPPNCQYGVVRWIGIHKDKNKPIVGLEMEEENNACTDGTFAGRKLFDCPPRKALFVYLHKVRRDPRFEEQIKYIERNETLAFGSLECPDIGGTIAPQDLVVDISSLCGRHKGIQGHHNSCYLDATLFSMFAFTVVFDSLLYRPKEEEDAEGYEEVQQVLLESIVNPLRKNFYVRADKILKLRTLLDKMGSVKGLTTEEKDPEEFLNSLLQQSLRADPFLKLSNGQESYYYQLFVEKAEKILPSTQQLLELSFLQSDLKLAEAPSCLVLQMPRCGKNYKMFKRIVPSLQIDVTDILESGPRECTICGAVALFECRDCYRKSFGDGLANIAFCDNCYKTSHTHAKRSGHKPKELRLHQEYMDFINGSTETMRNCCPFPRETMELFAIVCIEMSHYVAFVKCGMGPKAPWVFFDSMADRMGEQHGYNVPEVRPCPDITQWLSVDGQKEILACEDDKKLPELMRRLLCDSYMCMYQSPDVMMYK